MTRWLERTVRGASTKVARAVVAGALLASSFAATAVADAQDSKRWMPRLELDNDAYNFWLMPGDRTDEEYTNGVVASLESLYAPWWGGRLGGGAPACGASKRAIGTCLTTTVALSQEIYTPNLHRPPFSTPDWMNERPYAGWLALSGKGRRVSPRQLRTLSLAIGVTGKPSLAETMQDIAHHITAQWTREARGWETQIGFEPGIIAGYRHDVLALRVAPGGVGIVDVTPFAGVSLGNILTQGEVGARARVGMNLSHPWDPRMWRLRAPVELSFSAGGRVAYVARNVSLDGNLVNADRKVVRTPGISEYEFAIGARMKRISLGWRATTRSREYETGPSRFTWSTMHAGIEFFR